MRKIQKFSYLIILALAFSVCASNAHALFPMFCKTFLADATRMKSLKTQNDTEQEQEQNNEQDAEKAANFGNRIGTYASYEKLLENMDWDRFGDNPTAALSDAAGKTGKSLLGDAQKDLKEYAAKKQEERRAKKEAEKAKEEEQMTEEERLKKQQEEEQKQKKKKYWEGVRKWYKENGSAQSAVRDGGSQAASGNILEGLETTGKGLVDSFVDSQKDW